MNFVRLSGQFLGSVLLATFLGCVAQSQFNLAELTALGVPVPLDVRLTVTLQDLAGFSPSFGPIVAVGYLIAFGATAILQRFVSVGAVPIHAFAGGVAVLTAIVSMNALFDLTAIAAARTTAGFVSLILAGVAGGWLFGRMRT